MVLCLGLVGCGHLPQSTYLSPKQRQQALSSLTHWRAQGSLNLIAHNKRQMLSFNWQQECNNLFNIRFSVFTYSVLLRDDHGHVTVSKPVQGISPGLWPILLETQFWLRGLPVPVRSHDVRVLKSYDSYGRLTTLLQNGWVIYYPQYAHFLGIDLPKVIIMKGSGMELRIVISDWQGHASPAPRIPTDEADIVLLRSLKQ